MDEYNNVNPGNERPEENTQSGYQQSTGAAGSHRESPFANSPYESAYQNSYYQETPRGPEIEKKKKHHSGTGKRVAAAVAAVALVAGSCGLTAFGVAGYYQKENDQIVRQMNSRIQELEDDMRSVSPRETGDSISGSPVSSDGFLTPAQVFAQNKRAVVAISCLVQSPMGAGTSAGSGFIISDNGYIVTNAHVVEHATSVTAITYEGKEYPASIVGADAINDLAVLKVDGKDLPYVTMGSSDDLIVGDQVAAVGNALGQLSASMTVGYVSGVDRSVATDGTKINMLQTDAAINSGNSGGPLFNMKGEVVGITSAKYSGTTSSGASIEGISFAIPIDDVKGIIEDLAEHGQVTGAYLGVMVADMDPKVASLYGLPTGAYIVEVTPGFCAEAGGMQEKDIVLSIGEYDVDAMSDLTRALRKFDPGDTVDVVVFRNGREVTLTITLDERPVADEEMPNEGSYDEWHDYFFKDDKG